MQRDGSHALNSVRRSGSQSPPPSDSEVQLRNSPNYDAAARTGSSRRQRLQAWVQDDRYAWLIALAMWGQITTTTIAHEVMTPVAERSTDFSADPVARAIKIGFLVLGLCLILWRLMLSRIVVRQLNAGFLLYLALAVASTAWSIWPPATIARCVSIACMASLCLGFCLVAWEDHRYQNVVRPILTLLLLASLAFGLLYPDLGIEKGEGTLKNAWRGLTAQKNSFGQLSSFAAILWVHAYLSHERSKLLSVAGIGLSLSCLLLSRSSTSLLATTFAIAFMLLLLRAPTGIRRLTPMLVIVFAVVLLAYSLAVLRIVPGLDVLLLPVTAITGKDLTFSNRSEIWGIIREQIDLHPIRGSGYGAYWIGPEIYSPSYQFLSRAGYYPTESHNGYLESVNDLGFIGLLVLIAFLAIALRQCLLLLKIDRNQGALFLALFFAQALVNLSESTWMQINAGTSFVLMTLATFCLARALVEARLRGNRDVLPRLRTGRRRPGGARR